MSAHSAGAVGDILWGLLRILYGTWFVFFAGFMVVSFHGHIPGSFGPNADPFLAALNRIGFVEPMLIAVYVIGGAALLVGRTAPLGLVLLAGPVVVIVAFHLFHTRLFAWGGIWGAGWIALAWRLRGGFASLWNFAVIA